MTNAEAVNWLINITADIGKIEHQDLWHYEQALSEIREMLETEPQRMKGKWIKGIDIPNRNPYLHLADAMYCSECHNEAYWDTDYGQQLFDYCPNCGAYMRGTDDVD